MGSKYRVGVSLPLLGLLDQPFVSMSGAAMCQASGLYDLLVAIFKPSAFSRPDEIAPIRLTSVGQLSMSLSIDIDGAPMNRPGPSTSLPSLEVPALPDEADMLCAAYIAVKTMTGIE
jgi:hypothetical protein